MAPLHNGTKVFVEKALTELEQRVTRIEKTVFGKKVGILPDSKTNDPHEPPVPEEDHGTDVSVDVGISVDIKTKGDSD